MVLKPDKGEPRLKAPAMTRESVFNLWAHHMWVMGGTFLYPTHSGPVATPDIQRVDK